MNRPVPGLGRFVLVWLGLCVLLGSTLLVYRLDLGPWNFPANLGIAAAKAALIAAFYMHLWRGQGVLRLFAAAGLFWLAILFGLSATDFLFREVSGRSQPGHSPSMEFNGAGGGDAVATNRAEGGLPAHSTGGGGSGAFIPTVQGTRRSGLTRLR